MNPLGEKPPEIPDIKWGHWSEEIPGPKVEHIKQLRLEIDRYNQLYYAKGVSEIPDTHYDVLLKRLAKWERRRATKKTKALRFPELPLNESPTQQVGADWAPGFQEVVHRQKMLSLDNTYSEVEVRAFHARLLRLLGAEELSYTVEPKIDGVAVSLTYEQGRFVRAVTRGTGDKGDDITVNVLTIAALPRELKEVPGTVVPDVVEIRGEIYLTAAEFERLNAERAAAGEELYANPRNTAAGTIKQLDPAEVARRKLSIVLYSLGHCEPQVVATQAELHARLRAWGLPGVERIWHVKGIDAAWAAINELDQLRRSFAYGTDGAVIKLDDMALQREAGFTAKAPVWAIAYKYKPDTARTRLKDITIQVGKTGILSPVAELEPVFLAGSTIARATLHNEAEIRRKDIRIGDLVEIEKAGEVIPAVLRSFPEERPAGAAEFDLPAAVGHKCPVCGGKIAKLEVADEEAQGVAWKCQNYDCSAQRVGRLEFFCSRRALAIDSVGEIVAAKLVERDLVRSPLDLYTISESTLAELNLGTDEKKRILGEPIARRIVLAREAARELPLARWLYAFSIPDVGEETARDIARLHTDMESVASSAILRDIVELGRLNEEILANSPQAKENKSKNRAELEALRPIWKSLIAQADALAEKCIELGFASRAWKQPRDATIKVQNEETDRLKALRELIEQTSVKQRNGKSDADREKMKATHENAKKEADKLGEELIAAGFAERTPQPARYAALAVGPVAAKSLVGWFSSTTGTQFLEKMKELGISPKGEVTSQKHSSISGKTVVVTGSFKRIPRSALEAKIRELGGKLSAKISSNTDLLIAGEGGGSKRDDAARLGTRIVDEETFMTMILGSVSSDLELPLE